MKKSMANVASVASEVGTALFLTPIGKKVWPMWPVWPVWPNQPAGTFLDADWKKGMAGLPGLPGMINSFFL